MKKIEIAILLQIKQEVLNTLLEKRNLQDKQILNLSRKIDKLQNQLYYL